MITGIVVTYNTKELIKRAFESIRKFHPYMPIIIVDGSNYKNMCYVYVDSLQDEFTTVFHTEFNIGHGTGMDYGIRKCHTPYCLIFDSDIVMLKSPVKEMMTLMNEHTYAVGWKYAIGRDGFDYGTPGRNHRESIPYIHPYFMLLNKKKYFEFPPFVHHGAPCYKTMIDIYDKELSDKLLKNFEGLTGHTTGLGANWKGQPNDYIQHDFGGTRIANRVQGKSEIEGKWVY